MNNMTIFHDCIQLVWNSAFGVLVFPMVTYFNTFEREKNRNDLAELLLSVSLSGWYWVIKAFTYSRRKLHLTRWNNFAFNSKYF